MVDSNGLRTIGVLTKLDKQSSNKDRKEVEKKILNKDKIKLQKWHGMKCRSGEDIDKGITIK